MHTIAADPHVFPQRHWSKMPAQAGTVAFNDMSISATKMGPLIKMTYLLPGDWHIYIIRRLGDLFLLIKI